MKTKILLISLLFFYIGKILACSSDTYVTVNQPYGTLSCRKGSGYQLNNNYIWFINIGTNKKVRIKYYKDTPGSDRLSIYDVTSSTTFNQSINNPTYLVKEVTASFERGTVTTTLASGCCVILFQPTNASSAYPGIEIEFSAAPDANTAVTNSSSRITGSQYIMEKLGIGTDAPVMPLHIRQNLPIGKTDGSYIPLSRFQGRTMGTTGDQTVLADDYLYYTGGTINYIKGTAVNNTGVTPGTMNTWIEQNPLNKIISLGSQSQTLLEARSLSPEHDSLSHVEVNVGGEISSRQTGFGARLSFLGASTNAAPLQMYRYNRGPNKAELRLLVGNRLSDDIRFVAGTSSNQGRTWNSHLTVTGTGKIGIGPVETPLERLHVAGNIKADTIKAASLQLTGATRNDQFRQHRRRLAGGKDSQCAFAGIPVADIIGHAE